MIAEAVEREERKRAKWELAAATGSAYALLESLAASDGYSEPRSRE